MAKIVYVEWRDLEYNTEILGVFLNEEDAYRLRDKRQKELDDKGWTLDSVCVEIEDVEIQ